MYTQKNSNDLWPHLRDIMALDHSTLGLKNKFLEKKSGRIFLRLTSLLYKILPTNLGAWKPTFYKLFIHHIWGETVPREAVFIIQTSDRMQYFTILQCKLHSLNIQDHGSTCGLLVKPLKKIPKSPIRPAGSQQFWQAQNEWTIIELHFNKVKNLLCLLCLLLFFLFDGFITMCNLQKRLIRAAFWVLLQAVFMNDWKQTAQQLKLQERQRTTNKINIIRWTIYRDNNFHSRRQVLKCL